MTNYAPLLAFAHQLADAAGAMLRKFKANDERFYTQMKETLRKSNKGKVEGYGLIHFPKKK
jgi:hypothetical protein